MLCSRESAQNSPLNALSSKSSAQNPRQQSLSAIALPELSVKLKIMRHFPRLEATREGRPGFVSASKFEHRRDAVSYGNKETKTCNFSRAGKWVHIRRTRPFTDRVSARKCQRHGRLPIKIRFGQCQSEKYMVSSHPQKRWPREKPRLLDEPKEFPLFTRPLSKPLIIALAGWEIDGWTGGLYTSKTCIIVNF
jgi:hypothetical protein